MPQFIGDGAAILAVLALVIAFIALIALITRRIKRVPPNEALVIVGRGAGRGAPDAGQRVVVGGRVFVWPVLQQGFRMTLEQRQIGITVEGVDKNRIKLAIKASINFKVRGDEEGVRRAAQRFLSQQATLNDVINQSLEGSLRAIIGDMTIEQIISDRKSLQDAVVASTKADLAEQGLQVDLLNISDISTPGSDYLSNLGRAEAARARQVAEVKEAEARQVSEFAQIAAMEQIATRQRDLALKQASIKAQTDRANAEADASGRLARAEQDKLVAVLERDALVERARVTEEQLDIDVRKPAEADAYAAVQRATAQRDAANVATEAEAYRRTKIAEANKVAAVNDAEAAAQSTIKAGNAERDRQLAQAQAIEATGLARAAATRAEGLAAAEATRAQAEALREQGEAVLTQQVIAQLPAIVRAAAEPMAAIASLTVIGTDGASSLTKSVGQVLGEGQAMVRSLTGIDVSGLVERVVGPGAGSSGAHGSGARRSHRPDPLVADGPVRADGA